MFNSPSCSRVRSDTVDMPLAPAEARRFVSPRMQVRVSKNISDDSASMPGYRTANVSGKMSPTRPHRTKTTQPTRVNAPLDQRPHPYGMSQHVHWSPRYLASTGTRMGELPPMFAMTKK